MERLTNFELEQFEQQLINDGTDTQVRKLIDEVKEYRALAEQIGCPLEVKSQLYNGRCLYGEHDRERIVSIWINGIVVKRLVDKKKTMHKFSNYKKTWWLKADKSE